MCPQVTACGSLCFSRAWGQMDFCPPAVLPRHGEECDCGGGGEWELEGGCGPRGSGWSAISDSVPEFPGRGSCQPCLLFSQISERKACPASRLGKDMGTCPHTLKQGKMPCCEEKKQNLFGDLSFQ